jgi:tail tube protein gp19
MSRLSWSVDRRFGFKQSRQACAQGFCIEWEGIMAEFTVNPTRFDPYKNFKFRVKWDGQYIAGVSRIGALRRVTEVIEHREGGDPSSSRKSPGRTQFEPITLERGVTHDPAFEQWANKVWMLGGRRRRIVAEGFPQRHRDRDPQRSRSACHRLQGVPLLGLRISRRCPISTPMTAPSCSSASDWRTKAGSATARCWSRSSRALAVERGRAAGPHGVKSILRFAPTIVVARLDRGSNVPATVAIVREIRGVLDHPLSPETTTEIGAAPRGIGSRVIPGRLNAA